MGGRMLHDACIKLCLVNELVDVGFCWIERTKGARGLLCVFPTDALPFGTHTIHFDMSTRFVHHNAISSRYITFVCSVHFIIKKKKKIEREYHLTSTCIIRYGRICPFSIHTHTHNPSFTFIADRTYCSYFVCAGCPFSSEHWKSVEVKLNVHGFVLSASFYFMNKSVIILWFMVRMGKKARQFFYCFAQLKHN